MNNKPVPLPRKNGLLFVGNKAQQQYRVILFRQGGKTTSPTMNPNPLCLVGKSVKSAIVSPHHARNFKEFAGAIFDKPFRLEETRAEFLAMNKKDRGKIKETLPYFIVCILKPSRRERNKENALHSNMLCLDLDDSETARPFAENPSLIKERLQGLNYIAFRTISSTEEQPRLRIVVEADAIPADLHPSAVRTVGARLGIEQQFDPVSTNPVQPMIMPCIFKGECETLNSPELGSNFASRPFCVADIVHEEGAGTAKPNAIIVAGESDADLLAAGPPVPGITENDVLAALQKLDREMAYSDYIKVGYSIKHQFGEAGFDLFDGYFSASDKYDAQETAKYWKGLKCQRRTIRALFHDALEAGWDGVLQSGGKWLPKGGTLAAATLVQPVPLSASLAPVKPFDPAWLPSPFRPWISDIAERMQCPPEFPAVAAMAALSSVAGRRFCIQPKALDESYTEFPHLWAMLIGNPSLMKSPAMQATMRPLRAMEKEAFRVFDELERERKAAEIEAKIKRSNLEKRAKKADEKGEGFDFASLIQEDGESAPCRRFIVNDASIEALGEVLRHNLNGTLLYQDELAGLLAMLDKDGNQSLRAFLLQAWSGKEGFTFDRIGRGTRRIEACALSVLGSIQPGVIAHHVLAANGTGEGADGFMQRFSLMVWPDINPSWKDIDRPLDQQAEETAAATFRTLENMTPEVLLDMGARSGRDGIPTFQFAQDAQERFSEWREVLEHRLRSGTMAPAFEAHLGKYRKLVPALAVLIHVAEGQPGSVALSALERALSFADCLESHAARLYGSGVMAECDAAKALLQKLRAGDTGLPDKFTAREVKRRGWTHLTSSGEVEAACELLVDHHWLIATPQPTTGTGGRPTMFYSLNPLAKK